MTPALPAAIAVGSRVTAPVTPPRTFRRRPVLVTGRVISAGSDAITLKTAGGYFTVVAEDCEDAS